MTRILRVDLTKKAISIETVPEEDECKYIGGVGVATSILSREVPPGTGPLDPGNVLVLSIGPFGGTIVPFSGRHFFASRSPLTGIFGEASAGGFFGREFSSTSFHHAIISGKADAPVYLYITDGKAELKDATRLWGKTTSQVEDLIKKELGDEKIKIASIGPAGENLVLYAAIISETDRAAGRCGMGAVMGSKNLKAIAVKGTGKPAVADVEKLKIAAGKLRDLVKESLYAGALSQYGTQSTLVNGPGIGDVPVQNFSSSRWKGMSKLEPAAIDAKGAKKHACFNCPIACTSMFEQDGKKTRVPEYETLAMLGSNILVDDLDAITRWNVQLNDLGIDTISFGVTVASLLESIERNIDVGIPPGDLGITKIQDPEKGEIYNVWGITAAIDKLIPMVAKREGIGNDLADGVRRFVEKHGLPPDLATHGKGLEIPAHEPRANNLTALDYATSARGAYHCYMPMLLSSNMNFKVEAGLDKMVDRFSAEGHEVTARAVIAIQDASEAFSACGGCIFGFQALSGLAPWVDALSAISGHGWTVESWLKAGSEIFSLKRKFNEQCGVTKKDDMIGSRFFQGIAKGGTKKNIPPLDVLLLAYYKQRGWN